MSVNKAAAMMIAAILPEVVKQYPEVLDGLPAPKAEVFQMSVESSQFGKEDPRNGFSRNDTQYRVTLLKTAQGMKAVACTCYGFHYHGHCRHQLLAERRCQH